MSDPYSKDNSPSGWSPAPPPPVQYGTPYAPPYGYPPQVQPSNGMAVAALVVGIIGLVLFWVPLVGIVLAILAIIFGGIGISRANGGASGKGQAVAGLVLGIVTIAIYVLIVAVAVPS